MIRSHHLSKKEGIVHSVNRPQFGAMWHCVAAVFCICLVSLPATAAAVKQGGVSIDSFKVVNADNDYVYIELGGSNDGSVGPVCARASAKSKDGLVRAEGFENMSIPIGENFHGVLQLPRPASLNKQQTEFLLITVNSCGKQKLLVSKFIWVHEWPAIPANSPSAATDENADPATNNTWFVFWQNLSDEDFAALDLLLEKWNDPKERDKEGVWKLDRFRNALYYLTQQQKWQESIALIQRWHKFNRRSPGAAIAEAEYWSAYAWHIRGCRTCKDVDPVAMRVFRERMERAEQTLKDSKGYASNNPLWYEAYLDIAIDSKHSEKFIGDLFAEAIRKHPYFQPLYADMASYWTPKTGIKADWNKVEAVVNQAVTLTTSVDGISAYAQLYTMIGYQQEFGFELFQDTRASWTKMRDSFEELVTRYPTADNFNEFAAFACRAGDKDTYLKMRARMQDRVVPEKWPDNYSRDLCDHRFMQYS